MPRGGDNRAKNNQTDSNGKSYTVIHKIPDPPEYLNDKAVEIFNELASELIKAGRLQKVDIPLLGSLCSKIALEQQILRGLDEDDLFYTHSNGNQAQGAKFKMLMELSTQIKNIGDRFYFNPQSRVKNRIGGSKVIEKTDPAMKFLKKAK